MSNKKKHSKQIGVAFCRTHRTYEAAIHHLNLQERVLIEAAAKQGVTLKRVIKYQGRSASLEGLVELTKGADILYIASKDRLTRSYAYFSRIVDSLAAHGVEIRYVKEDIDSIFDNWVQHFRSEGDYWEKVAKQHIEKDSKKPC